METLFSVLWKLGLGRKRDLALFFFFFFFFFFPHVFKIKKYARKEVL